MSKYDDQFAIANAYDLIKDVRDYLSCIPETNVGGDDEAIFLTSRCDRWLAEQDQREK